MPYFLVRTQLSLQIILPCQNPHLKGNSEAWLSKHKHCNKENTVMGWGLGCKGKTYKGCVLFLAGLHHYLTAWP